MDLCAGMSPCADVTGADESKAQSCSFFYFIQTGALNVIALCSKEKNSFICLGIEKWLIFRTRLNSENIATTCLVVFTVYIYTHAFIRYMKTRHCVQSD